MTQRILEANTPQGLTDNEILPVLDELLAGHASRLGRAPVKCLLLPPDMTRMHSYAGNITGMLYTSLKKIHAACQVDILPALGTHEAMSEQEIRAFFGAEIPLECFKVHNWRTDVVKLGQVPAEYVREISEGLVDEAIDVEVNRRLLDPSYDLILSIGQVVPHEVVGMANYSKNIFVGCGGSSMINRTHMLGAFYGMERIMGRDGTPVRKVFDYAEQHFIPNLPLDYVLTVTTQAEGIIRVHGLYAGRSRSLFEQAVALSQQKNLTFLDRPMQKVVVYLDEREFKSTWLGNKSVYRTRMAIADGGELIVLAPGVRKFGEDDINDRLIRKYGYVGRKKVLELVKENEDLKGNLSVAAHLIHGSSDDRFRITYCPGGLTREETEGAAFGYMPLSEALSLYDPNKLKDGWNTLADGTEIFYVSNPALGLWALREKFQ
ncbi:MAG TPA: D-mannonate epimerase [Clostridiales bacterium]|nr:D-mannonate epimerase [Clostridiales bacterium]